MIAPAEFEGRRAALIDRMEDDGVVLLLGNDLVGMNYPGNPYPFRQDPSFRYFFGLDEPSAAGWIDLQTGEQRLYGHEPDLDSIIWEGDLPPLGERAEAFGTISPRPVGALADDLGDLAPGRRVHFLPPARAATAAKLRDLLGHTDASPDLIGAVVALRERKSPAELAEITEAVNRAGVLHTLAIQATTPGVVESDIVRQLQAKAASEGWDWSYPIIFSTRGEVLHNVNHANVMASGQLVVNDSGVNSSGGYASDITRSFPVDQRFTSEQRAVYETVLAAQAAALAAARVGTPYREAHFAAGRAITEGLTALGVMRGDVDESVASGAFAAFMPHGVGHMLGLDVHDMEGLGEDHVGYDAAHHRSTMFGIRNLRLGKPLNHGFVLTVEPGIYFIPALLEQWRREGTNAAFIDLDRALEFRDFGGVRVEDVATVTDTGAEILGAPIPKSVEEIEALRG